MITDILSIPDGLTLPHFHMGCTTGQNDLVITSDIVHLIVSHLLESGMHADPCNFSQWPESASVTIELGLV